MATLNSFKLVFGLTALTAVVACSPGAQLGSLDKSAKNFSIINGDEVQASDPIAQVTVAILGATKKNANDKNEKQEVFSCTGTLLTENVVLTAAHCVPVAPEGGARAAIIIFSTNMVEGSQNKEVVRRVAKFAIHSKYGKSEKNESNYDFGMLQFEGGIPAGYKVATILPGKLYSKLTVGDSIVVAGYGKMDDKTNKSSDVLRRGQVKILGAVNDGEVVFDQSDRKGVCSGDSGGPAFLTVDDQMYVFGVASRVSGETEETYCSKYSVHGLIGASGSFITDTLKAWAPAQAQ